MLALGRTDTLELEMGVDQRDILRVRPGQEVRLRVDAMPQQTFEGTVSSVAQLPVGAGDEVRYPVRALSPIPTGCSGRRWWPTPASLPTPPRP